MFLKIKKPDYLGASQWDVRHDGRTIQVSIVDHQWLRDFQNRRVVIHPGDSIEADIEWVVNYGYDGEVVSSHYTVHRVIGVRHNTGEQSNLPLLGQ